MADRSPENAAEDVAATFVRGINPIGQEKGDRASVVRQHPERRSVGAPVVLPADDFRSARNDGSEKVSVVIRRHTLQHRSDSLEPRPGVYRGLGQGHPRAVFLQVVLHEHQVPDLEELSLLVQPDEIFQAHLSVASLAGGAQVHVQLGVGPGRTSVGHLPEIVLVAQTVNPLVGNARDLPPEFAGFVVGVMDRHVQEVGIDAQPLAAGDPFPGELDRFFLEIVSEREVAQHFEEGLMAGGVAHLLQIVVLAACANALLHRDGARVVAMLQPLEDPLELHHAGIGKEQGGIIGRHQRRGGHGVMAA